MFVYKTATTITIILVYVDDIIFTSDNSKFCDFIIHQLHSKFAIKDLGYLNYFIGLEVVRTSTLIPYTNKISP